MSKFKIEYEELQKCPSCGKDKSFFELFDTTKDSLTNELNTFTSMEKKFPTVVNSRVRCVACDLIFMSPRLSDKSLSVIYKNWYEYAYKDIFINEDLISQRKKEFQKYHLNIVDLNAKHKGNLLDLGCGSGLFMSLAHEKGWSVYGVELDTFAAHQAIKRYNFPIYNGKLHNVPFKEKMDAVTLFDYLEHTKTPREDLCLVRDMLNKNGIVFIRVPNQKSLQSYFMREKWVGYISNHLFYFDSKTLVYMIESCGFKLKSLHCGNYCSQLDLILNNLSYLKRKFSNKKNIQNHYENQGKISSSRNYKLLAYIKAFFMQELDFIGGLLNKSNHLMLIAEKI